MQWFRLYDDVLDDPKVQQLKPELFKHWINLLCLANKNNPRGYLPLEWKDIAFRLRVSPTKAVEIVRELCRLELIDEDTSAPLWFRPHNWEERQKRSDNVAARVAKHRGNVSVTLPVTGGNDDGNVLDTDTEQSKRTPPTPSEGDETASSAKPLPTNGDAQTIVAKFCEAAGLDRPSNYGKAAGLATQIAKAGVGPDEIAALYVFTASRWKGTADLGKMLGSIDEFRSKPVPPPGYVDPDEAIRLWKNGGANEAPKQIRPFPRGAAS